MAKTYKFTFNGHEATVVVPENANGKWIWKTEFFEAFDGAERALLERGYTRVYYQISDEYGCYKAVRKMRAFYKYVVKEFSLCEKCCLFGFSRGGLYAFNFALSYPDYVEKVYLDAPVMDLKSWPIVDTKEQREMFACYTLNADTLLSFKENPVDKLEEYFSLGIPTLLIAGAKDEVVPVAENCGIMIEYCEKNNIPLEVIIKPDCGHHPHSLEDVTPIVAFIEK